MKHIILYIFCLSTMISSLSAQNGAFAQKDNRFRFGSIHKVNERNSYSIFYPVGVNEFDGLVILLHSDQSSNPSAYGNFIKELLSENYIVIFPSYQSFIWSNNKSDLKYINESLIEGYKDIEKNYPKVRSLPVAFIGHSMGGIIAYELATASPGPPKKPSCIVSITPGEVKHHEIGNLNFKKLDNYDVYLVIEEENDKFYRRKTGERIINNIKSADRKKYILHRKKEKQGSKHLNAWAYNERFSSKNNGGASYFSKFIGKTDEVDIEVYWKEVKAALRCAFSREGCEDFRIEKEEMRIDL